MGEVAEAAVAAGRPRNTCTRRTVPSAGTQFGVGIDALRDHRRPSPAKPILPDNRRGLTLELPALMKEPSILILSERERAQVGNSEGRAGAEIIHGKANAERLICRDAERPIEIAKQAVR